MNRQATLGYRSLRNSQPSAPPTESPIFIQSFCNTLFQGGVAAPLIKRSRSLAAQTGWLVISNRIRIATRAYREATRLFTNHPGRCAATPPLKRRGMNSVQHALHFPLIRVICGQPDRPGSGVPVCVFAQSVAAHDLKQTGVIGKA